MLKRIGKKRIIVFTVCAVLFILCSFAIVYLTPIVKPTTLTEAIDTYTINKPNVRLSVAVITDDNTNVYVFGHNGTNLKNKGTKYELGQLTQLFTGDITARAIFKGDITLEQDMGTVLPVPSGCYNPTVMDLITHTSAYSSYVPEDMGNSRNPYTDFSDFNLLLAMSDFEAAPDTTYISSESDFGAAVLGTFLANLYNVSPYTVINDYVHLNLGLEDTIVGTTSEKARHGYPWKVDDVYITSLGLTSTIDDVASYVKMHLSGDIDYMDMAATPLKEINADKDIGFFWNISKDGRLVSYSGQTRNYASCIYIDRQSGGAVVVLSNYPNDKYGSVDEIANLIMENGN